MSADSGSSSPSQYPTTDELQRRSLSDRARRLATARAASTPATSATAKSAAFVEDLARRARVSVEELLARVPADTLRRLKYPVFTHVNEDGTRTYKDDPGITEGLISTRGADRRDTPISSAPRPRDDQGRWIRQ